jgi:WD40 repeat protein
MLEGRAKPTMPPKDNEAPTPAEIARLKLWIDAGAKGPSGPQPKVQQLVTPQIKPKNTVTPAVTAAAVSPNGKLLALAGFGEVRILSVDSRAVVWKFTGIRGNVTAVGFSADGMQVIAAGGEPGLVGEAVIWNLGDKSVAQKFVGHKDSLYAAALSPDGTLLATGSYDQQAKLWDVKTGKELRTLTGHNGAIFDVAFHPQGKILATASADRTVKLWSVATGERLDTFGQPLKDVTCVVFSPDGRYVAAGAADSRLRIWKLSPTAKENTNPLIITRFAHEGALLDLSYARDGKLLATSGEDRAVKLWETKTFTEQAAFENQPDWVPALALAPDSQWLLAGRLDGSFALLDTKTGQPMMPPRPEITTIEPRGVQRGVANRLKLVGRNLSAVATINVTTSGGQPMVAVKIVRSQGSSDKQVWLDVTAPTGLARGAYKLTAVGPGGQSDPLTLQVDDLPQRQEREPDNQPIESELVALPGAVWGTIDRPGDRDHFRFAGKKGQTIVLDLAAKRLESTLNAVLVLLDPDGEVVASNNDFDGQNDPVVAFTLPRDGIYAVRVQDAQLTGMATHFYRLSAGQLPLVTGVYPLAVQMGKPSEIELSGYNLPAGSKVMVDAKQVGEVAVPIDSNRFRVVRDFRLMVTSEPELREHEPNDKPAEAMPVAVPAHVAGRLSSMKPGSDADLFRFETKQGQEWMIETLAAGRGSPTDTRIDVLDAKGKPVERLWLQAVLDSYITFRPITSTAADVRVKNWEEMQLNQFMYLQGEVCKTFRMPQGPDSGFQFYSTGGQRRSYFGTSATSHAMDEPCYIVEPHKPGTKLVPNGLPVFPLYYANDDDGERKIGTDSRLSFVAPADGAYLVRVSDSRGISGDRFAYRLTIRPRKPDFTVRLASPRPMVSPGSGAGILFQAERLDGFDEDIAIQVENLPTGFSLAEPVVVQAGHLDARGTLVAEAGAKVPTKEALQKITITARSLGAGSPLVHEVNRFTAIQLGEVPNVVVHLEPAELTIAPGSSITAILRIDRRDFKDRVQFDVDNLPHGVIVENIGLNGILIPEGQSQREIFLRAADWVPETDRYCFAETRNRSGKQTNPQASRPMLLHVRKAKEVAGR